jgi:hypothetical protein
MNQTETMTAGLAAADKVIAAQGDADLRSMLAAAWMLGMAQGGFEALTQLQAAAFIEKAKRAI